MAYIGTVPIPQSNEVRQEFLIDTASQSTFYTRTNYVPQFIEVYKNGLRLQTADFTATNGYTVTLATPAVLNDVVAIEYRINLQFNTNNQLQLNPGGSSVIDSQGFDVLYEDTGGAVTLTADEANVGSNALVVNSSGNVGIGTSSPHTGLDLRTHQSILEGYGLNWKATDGTNRVNIYADSSENLFFRNGAGSTERMRIDSSGNVGIGCDPSEKLDISGINGFVRLNGSSTSNASYHRYANGGDNKAFIGIENSSGQGLFGSNDAYGMSLGTPIATGVNIATNNVVRMRIDSSGNVGIGTSSPDYSLHLNPSTDTYGLKIQRGPSDYQYLRIGQNSGAGSFVSTAFGATLGIFRFSGSGTSAPDTLTEYMRIDSSGNVLVGTTTANAGTGFSNQSRRLLGGNVAGHTGGFGARGFAAANSSASFVLTNNACLRVTIFSTDSSTNARIGVYIFVGLNKAAGYDPKVLTVATTGSPQWSFSYSLNGSYDTLVTVNAGSDDQGTRIFIEPLGG